ncbi:MAG TPA: tetratricopeptide repeat protein [Gemmatimonadaceae bacterium]|jgi:tetratricopeptide (TPR) repeat protein
MTQTVTHGRTGTATDEARRLAELAQAAGLGECPSDALQWYREALSLLGGEGETTLLADVLRWQGSVLAGRGRTSEAEPFYQRSLEVAERIEYPVGRAYALNSLGSLALRRGDIDGAARLMSDSLFVAEQSQERRLVGMLQQNLGIIADIRGNPIAAFGHYRVAARAFESTNDLQPLCWVLSNLGYLHMKEGRFDESHDAYRRALAIARARGELLSEGIIEENLAELALRMGKTDEAYESFRRARQIAETRGDDLRLAAAMKLQGAYERLVGRYAESTDTLRHALTLSAITEDALLGGELLYQFALALRAFGDLRGSQDAFASAQDAFGRMGAREWVRRVRQRLTDADCSRYW